MYFRFGFAGNNQFSVSIKSDSSRLEDSWLGTRAMMSMLLLEECSACDGAGSGSDTHCCIADAAASRLHGARRNELIEQLDRCPERFFGNSFRSNCNECEPALLMLSVPLNFIVSAAHPLNGKLMPNQWLAFPIFLLHFRFCSALGRRPESRLDGEDGGALMKTVGLDF